MNAAEAKREYRRKLYADRKEAGLCVWCAAGLQEDDGLLCVECHEKNLASRKRCRLNGDARAKERAWHNATRRKRRANGQCAKCPRPSVDGKAMCQKHLEYHRKHSREWVRMRRAGITPIKPLLAKRRGPIGHGITEIREYQPIDEMAQTPRVRILLALAWLEWTSVHDLFAHLRVDTSNQGDNREYDNHMQMLSRLARWGIVDRRGKRNGYEYQINDAGRAEVKRMRAGDLRVRFRRSAA